MKASAQMNGTHYRSLARIHQAAHRKITRTHADFLIAVRVIQDGLGVVELLLFILVALPLVAAGA